ncbi:hypothetical protein V1523DRAFT_429887, partial [Lipomyces doorenjongii]
MNPNNNFSDLMSDMSDSDPVPLKFIVNNAVSDATTEETRAATSATPPDPEAFDHNNEVVSEPRMS